MLKYLDKDGLSYLWTKIKNMITTKTEYNDLLARVESLEESMQPSNITISGKSIAYVPEETGEYDLYYADSNKTELENFDKIAQLNYTGTEVKYEDFNARNIAPENAKYIISKKDNVVKDFAIVPNSWKPNLGEKLYSFGLLSDIHIDGDGDDNGNSIQDFTKELTYFNTKNVDFIAITGDLTFDGRVEDYQKYKEIVQGNSARKNYNSIYGKSRCTNRF